MGKINIGRVIVGGLLAGVVINIGESLLNAVILMEQWEAALKALNKPPMSGSTIALYVVMGFGLGIVAVWLYAAIRPRMGAGPKTAVCAGLTVWALAYLYPNVGLLPIDLFPTSLLLWSVAWGLGEIVIASVAGAWLYKEEA